MSAGDFENVLFNIREFFDKSTMQLLAAQSGAGRAELLHHMMEHELKASASMEVSCKKGCGGCCHYEVEITQDESELLAEIVTNGFAVDMKRLETQATYERQSPEWAKFWSAENRCVFLSAEGSCGIYEDRPSICRKHSVVTPATSCTTLGELVTPVQVPLAEILLSAALSIPGSKHASLSKMLLSALDKTSEPASKSPAPFLESADVGGL
jgi:Fe-S-cluster containining protein